ncbi:MAG: hypothetical protein ACI4HM_00870 [Ruminococcus sp.]
MKKGKSASTKRGRNFNILLTVVALILIVAVGGFATYSWVEQATTLDVNMDGTIQRVPGGNTEYYHQVTLKKGEDSAISLNDYVDKASDMMLSPVSSADGINFFMKNGTTYANSSPSGRNVSYLTFDFDVTSDTATSIYFDDGYNSNRVEDLTNHPKPSFKFGDDGVELESVRVAIQVNNDTPMIFSKSGGTNTGISDINGNTSEDAPTIKKFSDYEFGKNSLFALEAGAKTKVRITIWLEGTDDNLGEEYNNATTKTLNMNLMLTTPWNKATTVKLVDKTANGMFANSTTGKFYLVNGETDTEMTPTTEDEIKYWTANITGSQDSLTFKYVVDSSTSYTWKATGRGDNFYYNIFDYDTSNGYGVWSTTPIETEAIDIKDCIVGTSLTTGTNGELDSHMKVSTDGTNYYRAAYKSTESKWYVNIDKAYSEFYVQYYNDDSELVAKWNATDGRTDKETQTTYYILDTEGGTADYSLGSWVNEYNVYFYDGTVDQVTTKTGTTIAYEAFSGDTSISSGDVVTDSTAEYRFVAENQLKYTDKIDKVVFTLSRPAKNETDSIKYTWNGDGKVNKDIYYTANSYTKD